MDVIIDLSEDNTEEETTPTRYNLEVIVELEELWEAISTPIDYARIQVQTIVGMPVMIEGVKHRVDVSLNDNFKVVDIQEKTVRQHGFMEGLYDGTRPIAMSAQVWKYDVVPLQEVE